MAPSFDYNLMEMTALIRRSTYRTTISCTCSTTIRIRGWGWTALQSFYASALGSHSPLLCAWAMCPVALNTFKSRSAHTMRLFCTAVAAETSEKHKQCLHVCSAVQFRLMCGLRRATVH